MMKKRNVGRGMRVLSVVFLGMVLAVSAQAQWTDGQDAQYVVGQPDFISWASATTATGLKNPSGLAIDKPHGKMYVADYGNHRVLRYAYPLSGNQPSAELVLGQADFTSGSANRGGAVGANTMNGAAACAVDSSGRLWIGDASNNRVLWFDDAYAISSDGAAADGVLGQVDFTSADTNGGGSVAADSMNHPYGVYIDPWGNLLVTDFDNHRVLRFDDASSLSNGAAADAVLGQADFVSNAQNRGGSAAANTLYQPDGVVAVGSALFVADKGNHRVLRYDAYLSKADGAAADGVLGQPDFVTATGGATQSILYGPRLVEADGAGRLYVADTDNNRILIFEGAVGKGNGANADSVLGQTDFTSWEGDTTQGRLWTPDQMAVDGDAGYLLVADENNNRVVQFNASTTLPVALGAFAIE
ncbi:MAG TPA: NHL repeat-containing protein [Candidatus Hydrogenedentes bacterium]|nr:NHL repeat-containing protein [Candidatus Hydrogenedentota bacterium]HPG65600.1 NHL repeat-containing protein [Candidatus Hydrogenedentota bacterium]